MTPCLSERATTDSCYKLAYQHGNYLPGYWKEWFRAYRLETNGKLRTGDFTVRLWFEDESTAECKWAFCELDPDREEFAVFTEHSRYHVFGSREPKWNGLQASLADELA